MCFYGRGKTAGKMAEDSGALFARGTAQRRKAGVETLGDAVVQAQSAGHRTGRAAYSASFYGGGSGSGSIVKWEGRRSSSGRLYAL